jgi:MarR family transcriptional regulator, transcriptional regulator for hemolysin
MKPHQSFFYHYRAMYRPFINKLNDYLAKHQLYSAQWAVLNLLDKEGAHTLVEISNYLNVEKPTVTRIFQRLMELGYIESIPGKDKREKKIQLTELGKKVCTEIQVTIEEFQKDALRGISEAEQLEVSRILAKVRGNLIQ